MCSRSPRCLLLRALASFVRGIGFTFIPACSSCRRVETTFSHLQPALYDPFSFKKVLSRRSAVQWCYPASPRIRISVPVASDHFVCDQCRAIRRRARDARRTKKPGVIKLGFQFFNTIRARTVPSQDQGGCRRSRWPLRAGNQSRSRVQPRRDLGGPRAHAFPFLAQLYI